MRFKTIVSLALTLATPIQASAAAQATGKRSGSERPLNQYSMEQFMATPTVNGSSFSADGKRILFSSNESGIFNVYSMPVAGGKPEALTKSTIDSTFAISYFPRDDLQAQEMQNRGLNVADMPGLMPAPANHIVKASM